jgi:uncharacterized protein DUF397
LTTQINKWFVPSRTHNNGTCVETKITEDTVCVRNSHRRNAGTAEFTHAEWEVFIAGVKDGEYDIPLEFRRQPEPRSDDDAGAPR